jgi:hypothetical protein
MVCNPCRILKFGKHSLCYERMPNAGVKDMWNVNKFCSVVLSSDLGDLKWQDDWLTIICM